MNALTRTQVASIVQDPALIGYPPALPIEIALQEFTPQQVCEAYGIDAAQWDAIRTNPIFVSDLKARIVELQTEGVSFKMKARLQSIEYLRKLWNITEDGEVPAAVRSSIMQFVIRAAGFDGSKDQAAANSAVLGNALSITLHLGK